MRSRFLNFSFIAAILLSSSNLTPTLADMTPKKIEYEKKSVLFSQASTGEGTQLDDSNNSAGERKNEGDRLFQEGNKRFSNRQYREAIANFQQVLTIRREIGDRVGEAETLQKIGASYDRLGEFPPALQFYQQALALRRQIGDKAGEGSSLNSIGGIYYQQGNYQQALEFFQQTLSIRRQVADKLGEGRTLNNIGLIYENLGQYPRALEFYQQALMLFKDAKYSLGEGAILNNIGLIYNQLGQYSQALEFYQQALKIRQEINDRTGIGTTLHNIGYAHDRQQQYEKALQFYQQALAVRKEVGDRAGTATTLNNIGLAYDNLGKPSQALESLKQALAIFQEIGDRANEGNTLDSIGTVYKSLRQYTPALDSYHQALAIIKEVANRPLERTTLSNIGQLLELQNQPQLAITFYKQSVNVTEAIRRDLRNLTREQQQSYTATVADTYRSLADLLLKQNRVLEAQQVVDLLKVQEIDNYLHNVRGNEQTSKGVDSLPPEQKIEANYTAIQDKAIALGKELTQLQKIPAANRTPEQQKRIAELVELQQQIRAEFNNFINSPDIQQLTRQLNQTSGGESLNLQILNKLQRELKQLKQNAIVLYPLILEDRLELVLVTSYSPPIRRTVTIKREELNRMILEFSAALRSPYTDPKIPAKKFYDLLIKPIENDLTQAQIQTIIYAPDGQLRYLPLAALYDGKQWLIQRFSINNITAASLTDFTSKPPSPPHVLAAAFTQGTYNINLADRQLTFRGLPFAAKEVENLATIIPSTTKVLDNSFTPATIIPQLNDYNIIHFATHAAFAIGQPEDSFILFGDGSKVTLKDVETWSLPNVELVVLSACETGVGGQLGNGEEILGFGYQMQLTGARATISSLWSVSDGGTQSLMDAFYTSLGKGNISKVEAMRQAQISLISNNSQVIEQQRGIAVQTRPDSSLSPTVANNLSHPYYWAAFILIGNGF